MSKISFVEKIIRQAINDQQIGIQRITQGQDGEKFKITTSKGQVLFGRVKEEGGSQELPYQEAEVLNKINSQHIIRPIKTDRIKGYYVIIRPFVEGITLEERLKNGALESKEVRKLAEVLINCVEALSLIRAVHFDIKPANIIVGKDGNFYLIDFGAAKFLKKMKMEKIHPARRYIAPEVLDYLFKQTDLALHQLSTLSDMYGVGAVLYSAITGHGISEFLTSSSKILQEVPPPVEFFKPNFDPIISNMVASLLSKEPARRIRPEDAKLLLSSQKTTSKSIPIYFLKTKAGRGNEHMKMLDSIMKGGSSTGIYWASTGSPPSLPKKSSIHNFIWETPFPKNLKIFKEDLSRQYRRGVLALCVPSIELENPTDPTILRKNSDIIDFAIRWKRKFANHLPLLVVIAIDEALLTSTEVNSVKNIYAAKSIDGIIIRVCVPANTMFLDGRHLKAIKGFIEPWVDKERVVLFDGDLSMLPLALFGVSGLISSTYPKINILVKRKKALSFPPRKPNGMYIRKFLEIIPYNSVTSLRGTKFGKAIVGCSCPACLSTFMHPTRWASRWGRAERREHFIYTIPDEIKSTKTSSPEEFKKRILEAQHEAGRFSSIIPINLPRLKHWIDFLS